MEINNTDEIEEIEDVEQVKKVVKLTKKQMNELGIIKKKEISEKERLRNEALAKGNRERAIAKKELRVANENKIYKYNDEVDIIQKPKNKYVKKPIILKPDVEDDETDANETDDELKEYLEYQKFKTNKKKVSTVKKPRVKKPILQEEEESDDGYIQKKQQKATAILETVNKLDSAINKLNNNPYTAFFNKK
jgi:hypothetical protein